MGSASIRKLPLGFCVQSTGHYNIIVFFSILNLKSSSEENLLNQLTGRPKPFKSLFFEP